MAFLPAALELNGAPYVMRGTVLTAIFNSGPVRGLQQKRAAARLEGLKG